MDESGQERAKGMETADEAQRRRFVAKSILSAEMDGVEVIVDLANNVSIRGMGDKVAIWSPVLTKYSRDIVVIVSHARRTTENLMRRLIAYKRGV